MKKIIFFIFLTINLFCNDLIYVKNYKLDVGRYEGSLYTGYINIDGYPIGDGILMCDNKPNKVEYEAKFVKGIAQEGKFTACKNWSTKEYGDKNGEYIVQYEGHFGNIKNYDKQIYVSGNKLTFTFIDSIINKVEGTYFRKNEWSDDHYLDGTLYTKDRPLKELTCRFRIPRIFCTKGEMKWVHQDHKFNGYTTGDYNDQIEGLITWNDGTNYEYNGQWNYEKIAKLKKRLDLINKQESKVDSKIESSTQVEKIKPVKEYNPGVIVENKRPSKEYKEKELAPINME